MTNGHAHYADWNAAYVLGSLAPAERRQFEAHLEGCGRCQTSVAELSGLPGLLARLDPGRALELLERADDQPAADAAQVPPLPTELVARIQQREATRRSRRRTRLLLGLSAAAVIAAAVAIPVSIASVPHPTVSTALSPVVSSPLSAQVALTSVGWGTRIEMTCRYQDLDSGAPPSTRWDYALWVVQKDGSASELSSWSAANNSTVTLSAGTSVPVGEIAAVQVRSVGDGRVLLESDLHP
ncbi:MAG TPA: zf-HC2 domain-containing protein [Pseudolysinimonas sp.]|nr:zf-HC2 domain-containing protein [Pseudolysinimonas sp.]